MRPLRIAAVNCALAPALRALGHDVISLKPAAGLVHLPALLEKEDFEPDLIIQQEALGPRKLIQGLNELDCPKVFWSIDTHLNAWWHKWYGRFFDIVFTTQEHWVGRLRSMGLENVAWLPWYGCGHSFKPFSERDVPVGFVGRLTGQRQVRRWLAEFLRSRLPFVLRQDVAEKDLPEAYSRIRLVPNEAILGELNFRVFEAASAGCAVFTPRIKTDMGRLFAVGEEVAVYEDALELAELLTYYHDRPDLAERMGEKARERVLAEHLPVHRARRLLEAVEALDAPGCRGSDADWTALLLELDDSGMLKVDLRLLGVRLGGEAHAPEGAARLVRHLAGQGDMERLKGILVAALGQNVHAGHADFDLAASMAGLRLGQFDLAKAFWYRSIDGREKAWAKPDGPAHLLVLWAEELVRRGRVCRPGFPFDPAAHLPATALECLVWARELHGPSIELGRRMDGLLRDMEGGEHLRLGVLSDLSLRRRSDWRVGLELGLLDLKCFRVDAGLEEIAQARDMAESQGRVESFARVLAARDPHGRVARMVGVAAARDAVS